MSREQHRERGVQMSEGGMVGHAVPGEHDRAAEGGAAQREVS